MGNLKAMGNNLTLPRGDTGSVWFGSGWTEWSADARGIFAIANAAGEVMLYEIHELDAEGGFEVVFYNSTTDTWPVGAYSYDVAFVNNPDYETVNGQLRVVDGTDVLHLWDPATFTLKKTVVEV